MSYRLSRFIPAAELLLIFPEGKEIIPLKISELKGVEIKITEVIKRKLIFIRGKNLDPFSQWFWKRCLAMIDGGELLKVQDHISRLERLQAVSDGRDSTSRGYISTEAIEQARSVPIQDLIDQPMRKSGRTLIGLCPFHKEKNPSFYLYQETNSFYCFSCHRGGDSIRFVRLLHYFSFSGAIRYLIGEKS